MELLEIDEIQAQAILDMQLRRLAALERQKIIDRLAELEAIIADLEDILASEERQRQIIGDELAEIVEKYGDERRTQIIAADGDLSMEDLIPDEDLVVTITRGGYAKRTRADLYRTQKRGGKGVRGAQLRHDDVVEHFIATTNHHWLLFFTTGPGLPDQGLQPARGQPRRQGRPRRRPARLPAGRVRSPQVLAIRDYEQAPYLVLATRNGLVKKTRLTEYDSPRQAGVIAINFREDDDELIGAELVSTPTTTSCWSPARARRCASAPTTASCGRWAGPRSGVTGMKFRGGDELLSMSVIRAAQVAAEEAAEAPRRRRRGRRASTADAAVRLHHHRRRVRQALADRRLPPANRGALGHQGDVAGQRRTAAPWSARSSSSDGDEVLSIPTRPGHAQPDNADFRPTGRATMGVKFVTPKDGDAVAVVARSVEAEEVDEEPATEAVDGGHRRRDVIAGDSSSETADAARDRDADAPSTDRRPAEMPVESVGRHESSREPTARCPRGANASSDRRCRRRAGPAPPSPASATDEVRAARPSPAAPARDVRRKSGQPDAACATVRRAAVPARRARLRLTRIDPWSVMKMAFLLSIAFGIVTVVAVTDRVGGARRGRASGSPSTPVVDTSRRASTATNFDVDNYLGTSPGARLHDAGRGRSTSCSSPRWPPSVRSSTTWPPRCSVASRSPSPRTSAEPAAGGPRDRFVAALTSGGNLPASGWRPRRSVRTRAYSSDG